jgi:DNA-binding NarL/FixJ family response regulator
MAERVRPDIVLLDIELPDGDGIQLCRKLLRLYPQMAVVIMSAHSEDIFRDEAMRAGARGFIRKHELSATRLKQALAHPIEG